MSKLYSIFIILLLNTHNLIAQININLSLDKDLERDLYLAFYNSRDSILTYLDRDEVATYYFSSKCKLDDIRFNKLVLINVPNLDSVIKAKKTGINVINFCGFALNRGKLFIEICEFFATYKRGKYYFGAGNGRRFLLRYDDISNTFKIEKME